MCLGAVHNTMETSQLNHTPLTTTQTDERGLRILAKSVYRELKDSGCSRADMVAFANELLDLIAGELRPDAKSTELK